MYQLKKIHRNIVIGFFAVFLAGIAIFLLTETLYKEIQDNKIPQEKQVTEKTLSVIKAPEPGDVGEKDKWFAIPTISAPAATGVEAKIRSFSVNIDKGAFSASKIAVNESDTINIVLHATDKDYRVSIPSYNLSQSITKGGTKIMQFQAVSSGIFDYSCDSCKDKWQLLVIKRE